MKSQQSLLVLNTVLVVMQRIVAWLIRHGVTYVEFSQVLKKLFLQQAIAEAKHLGSKETDSALSLLSGLQRRDVQILRLALEEEPIVTQTKSTVPAEVIGKWIANNYSENLAFSLSSEEEGHHQISFEQLVRLVSKDKHPRSILNELIRLHVVEWNEQTDEILLSRKAFLPNNDGESYQLFSRIMSDHIAASVHNLDGNHRKFLDQAVFVDEITPESAEILQQYSRKKWQAFMQEIMTLADVLCENDKEKSNSNYRFTIGMFDFYTPEVSLSCDS